MTVDPNQTIANLILFLLLPAGLTMGCVRSKEDKGPALKYRPDNSNAAPVNAHLGHYGPDPTLMGHSPAMKTHNNSYNSQAAGLTPFGGASSIMTPFGGASTSFTSVAVSSPFPSVITGQFEDFRFQRETHRTRNKGNCTFEKKVFDNFDTILNMNEMFFSIQIYSDNVGPEAPSV